MSRKQQILQSQLDEDQRRELDLTRRLNGLPVESRRDFVLREQAEPMKRSMTGSAANFDDNTQSFDFTFSSEYAVDRWFGKEILIHDPEAADLSRLNDSGPFCINHDAGEGHIGTHEKAWIDLQKRVGRGRARLSKNNPRAVQEYLDIKDAIRLHISTRYRILDLVIHQFEDKPDEYHITRWEVLENSTVAIPADPSVAVGRNYDAGPARSTTKESRMKTKPDGADTSRDREELEQLRTEKTFRTIGRNFNVPELAEQAIREGWPQQRLVDMALESKNMAAPPSGELGLSARDIAGYRLTRLLNALANPTERRAQEDAAAELEMSAAAERASGKTAKGALVPVDVLNNRFLQQGDGQRGMSTMTGPQGGYLVGTDIRGDLFVDALRPQSNVLQLCTSLSDLVGNMSIPKQASLSDVGWVQQDHDVPDTQAYLGSLELSPNTIGGSTYVDRRTLKQSCIDVEQFVRRELTGGIAEGVDRTAFAGTGVGPEPLGILNKPGVAIVEGGTDGAAPNRDHMVELLSKLGNVNALGSRMAFVTNSFVRGKLLMTPEHATANVGGWVWGKSAGLDPNVGEVIGFPAHVSNLVPNDLTKGSAIAICSAVIFANWQDLIFASWGPMDIIVDPYTYARRGGIRVSVLYDADLSIRRVESFAVMKDALAN